jgi:hypothetical protein
MVFVAGFSKHAARRVLAAIMIATFLLLAVPFEAQSATFEKPFLDTNDFYLRSAGFKIKFANDAAGQKAMRALPMHRMVAQKTPGGVRYLFAEPKICVCIFIGTADNLQSYRDIVANPLPTVDNVPADYTTQASALLADMSDIEDDSLADFLRNYY